MQPASIRPHLALRAIASALLVLTLAACGASTPSGDGDDGGGGGGGGDPTDFRWSLTDATTFEEIKGTTATISEDAITGTGSVPAGWSLEISRPGGFVDEATYASYDDPDSGVTADLTVTIGAPDGSTCTVGPAETSITENGPNAGDTYAQATYFGTDETDGRPLVSFAFLSAACDDLPGASGSVNIWLFGFGSP